MRHRLHLIMAALLLAASSANAQEIDPNSLDALRAKAAGQSDASVNVKTMTENDGAEPNHATTTVTTEVEIPKQRAAQGVPIEESIEEADYPPMTDEASSLVYVTGGVGAAEIAYFKQLAADYTFKLLMADAGGHLVSDATVSIHAVPSGVAATFEEVGPYLLVKLPAGKYKITAKANGVEVLRDITVKAGKQTVMDARF